MRRWWSKQPQRARAWGIVLALIGCAVVTYAIVPGQGEEPETAAQGPTATLAPMATTAATQTPAPTATLTVLERRASQVDGVVAVRAASMSQMGSGTVVYLEIDVQPGYNTPEMAAALRQAAMQAAISMYGSGEVGMLDFGVILWDGQGPAIDYTWDNASDTWRTTTLSATPVQ